MTKEPMKTVYLLRTRLNDSDPWSEPEYYRTRKERDREGAMARILGGIRTHSYDEKLPKAEAEKILSGDI